MKVLTVIATIIASISSSSQSKPQFQPRIMNGFKAIPHSIPYQAYLEVYPSVYERTYPCSGALISRNYIVTSAGCFYASTVVKNQTVYVTLGVHKLLTFEKHRVKLASNSIKVHEKYSLGDNSIALIKLPKTVPITTEIKPVKLPSRQDATNSYAGVTARMTGWGQTDDAPTASDALIYADVQVISNEECKKSDKTRFSQDSGILCATSINNANICNADDGNPLVYNGTLIGLGFVTGANYCKLGRPILFIRITSYLDWLQENTDIVID